MPGLVSRLQPDDTVLQFETAARQRFAEAALLYHGPRPYAAIYLYGYSVEMWLKAAYFHNEGVIATLSAPIVRADRDRAWAQRAAAGAPPRHSNQHDVEAWAYLLIYIRAVAGIHAPYPPLLVSTLQRYGRVLYEHWNVEMRYQHVDPVRTVEVEEVREVAEWFAVNYAAL